MKRVVVTGMAGFTGLGSDWADIRAAMGAGQSAVRHMAEWSDIKGLNSLLGAPVSDFALPEHFTRVKTRTMGRNAKLAVRASELALERAGLGDPEFLHSGRMGVSYGSSSGSSDALAEMAPILLSRSARKINATSYVRLMSHTAAANISLFFRLKGRVIPTISACTAGSQGIGYGYEAIKFGLQDIMLAGGSEELCPSHAGVFDILYATSTRNEAPGTTPRPFDVDRDGLVVGEGSATLVLEEYEHARERGADIHAELVGFATNADGDHITRPNSQSMARVMRMALEDAGLQPADIGYVSAHGTATLAGDIAESQATQEVFGQGAPVSSIKGYLGHTLGACGAIEAWLGIRMMNDGWFAANMNLDQVDPECGDLDYIRGEPRQKDVAYIMSNNFAFGGINTSLVFRRIDG